MPALAEFRACMRGILCPPALFQEMVTSSELFSLIMPLRTVSLRQKTPPPTRAGVISGSKDQRGRHLTRRYVSADGRFCAFIASLSHWLARSIQSALRSGSSNMPASFRHASAFRRNSAGSSGTPIRTLKIPYRQIRTGETQTKTEGSELGCPRNLM